MFSKKSTLASVAVVFVYLFIEWDNKFINYYFNLLVLFKLKMYIDNYSVVTVDRNKKKLMARTNLLLGHLFALIVLGARVKNILNKKQKTKNDE